MQKFILDVDGKELIGSRIYLRQGDGGIQTVEVQVQKSGQPYDATGCALKFEANTPSSKQTSGDAVAVDATQGKYTYTFTSADGSEAGRLSPAFFRLYDSENNALSTRTVEVIVERNADLTKPQADGYVNQADKLLEDMIAEKEKVDAVLPEINATLATQQTQMDALEQTYSEIKMDGRTPSVHFAYSWNVTGTDRMMLLYPGENLIPSGSSSPKFASYNSSVITYEESQAVTEWGATDAVKHTVSGGSTVICATLKIGGSYAEGKKYYNSIYVKNVGTSRLVISNNTGGATAVEPSESKLVTLTGIGRTTPTARQFVLQKAQLTDTAEFVLWHAKIEQNEVATTWTPSPSEDIEGAYPSYMGIRTDYTPTASTNPADYTWARIRGDLTPPATKDYVNSQIAAAIANITEA